VALTAFLTPEGEVFFGGTYFPPDNNAYGRPGFRRVADWKSRATFREEQERVTTNAHAIREHVVQTLDEAKPAWSAPIWSAARQTDGQGFRRALRRLRRGTQVPASRGQRIPARALA